jgi:4-amino-4-deoxy-L-arabinose transferase-like glycosyltransferase
MIERHGMPLWNELFGDNHWRRMVLGRHGDRGTFEYFIRELGYSLLPWVALAPAALVTMVMRRSEDVRRQAIYWLGAIWFVAGYAVVSMSMTKFHHYVLPAIPGLAIVIGCFLDDLIERRDVRRGLTVALLGLPLLLVVTVRSGRGQERLPALPLAVLVRLHPQPARPPLARPARLPRAALTSSPAPSPS